MKSDLENLPYYCGLSGIHLPVPKYRFPEEHRSSSRLEYYSTFFNSLEINSTFYKLPLVTTLHKWSRSVNDNFRFTLKFWKEVTHKKDLSFDAIDVMKFLETADAIGTKKGCLLIQFPPSLKITCLEQLHILLEQIKKRVHHDWCIAVEFRDASWYHEEVYSLAKENNTTVVTHDKGRSSSPFPDEGRETLYIRFHGPTGDYRGSYTDPFLQEYAGYIADWLLNGKRVYVYFNNTMGDAFNNLQTLNRKLAESLTQV